MDFRACVALSRRNSEWRDRARNVGAAMAANSYVKALGNGLPPRISDPSLVGLDDFKVEEVWWLACEELEG